MKRFWRTLTASVAFSSAEVEALLGRAMNQRLHVLRKARAAVADSGKQELRADSPIRAHPAPHVVDSAPTASHRFAIWLMNEMRIASIALEAYLVSSAERGSITSSGLSVRRKAHGIRAGSRSPARWPSRSPRGRAHEILDRRAFLEKLGHRADVDPMIHLALDDFAHRSLVPTGTVLLIAMIW